MPIVQTSYPLRQDAFIPGQPTNSRYRSDYGVVQTADGIGFGQPVARGTITTPMQAGGSLNDSVVLFAAGLTLLGVSRRDQGRAAIDGDKSPRGAPLSYFIGADGVAVLSDAAVAIDTQVRWNSVTGRYTNAAASATVLELPGWLFSSIATAAGQLVVIRR